MSFQRADQFIVHTDSLVFCRAAEKGYSAAPLINEMLVCLERIKLSFGVGIELRFIPTEINFADMPTKIFPHPDYPILINSNLFYIQGQRQTKHGGEASAWIARSQAYPDWANSWMNSASVNTNQQA
jgi:hypothetical protein